MRICRRRDAGQRPQRPLCHGGRQGEDPHQPRRRSGGASSIFSIFPMWAATVMPLCSRSCKAKAPAKHRGAVRRDGRTCGAPVAMVIHNGDQHSRDYSGLKRTPRPSHADYTAIIKYGENYDIRGGGQFSGRLTAPLCFAGAFALQLLGQRGITVAAHIGQIENIVDAQDRISPRTPRPGASPAPGSGWRQWPPSWRCGGRCSSPRPTVWAVRWMCGAFPNIPHRATG